MNVIFQIQGGLGKSVAGTAVLKAIKKKYSKANIIVVTEHPQVFINNPNTNRVLQSHQTNGLYKTYIDKKDVKVFFADPYHHNDFIYCLKIFQHSLIIHLMKFSILMR